jgi:predicted GNAT family N-acyltransferase
MAVAQTLRSSGVGRQVLEALLRSAAQAGNTTALLHAQTSAIDFYLRAGFQPSGPAFVEAGIAHQEMTLPLAARPQAG